jgi:arginine deiminase
VAENRIRASRRTGDRDRLSADVWQLHDGGYRLVEEGLDFLTYLQSELADELVSVSVEDRLRYGTNFLTIGPRRILAVAGISEELRSRFAEAGVDVELIDFTELSGGYGAAHCTTQVLRRSRPTLRAVESEAKARTPR